MEVASALESLSRRVPGFLLLVEAASIRGKAREIPAVLLQQALLRLG